MFLVARGDVVYRRSDITANDDCKKKKRKEERTTTTLDQPVGRVEYRAFAVHEVRFRIPATS